MKIINGLDDFGEIDIVGLQPDDRLPNDYLRMVARIFAAYRESPLEKAVVAYIDGFQIHAVDNTVDQTYDFTINGGSCFIDDQFVGFLDNMFIQEPYSTFVAGRDYSIVVYYEWINITPPMRPIIKFVTYEGPESIDDQTMLEIGRFTITPQREFIMHPQDLTGLYLRNFVKLFSNIEENILENIDLFKFQYIIIPDSAISPETSSGDFVFFDFIDGYYKPARACTKQFDKAIGLYLRNKSSGSNYLIFSGIVEIDPEKFELDADHIHLVNLEQGATYYLEDGCTETDKYKLGSVRQQYVDKTLFPDPGELGVYYIDSSTDVAWVWNPNKTKLDIDGNPLLDVNGEIIKGDYDVASPQPELEDKRGKITKRFFPSTVRIGFAIDHKTLSIDMDFSSELNVMNILEIIGNSVLFKEHYDAYKAYYEYISKIALSGSWIAEMQTEIDEVNIELQNNLQNQTTLTTTVSDKQTTFNDFSETYIVSDSELATNLGLALTGVGKIQMDNQNWESIKSMGYQLAAEVFATATSAQEKLEAFDAFISDPNNLDINKISESEIKIQAQILSSNLNNFFTNTFNGSFGQGYAFYDVFYMDVLNIASTSYQQGLAEKNANTIANILDIVRPWYYAMKPYFEYDYAQNNIDNYQNLYADISNVVEKLIFFNAPRIQTPPSAVGSFNGQAGIIDADFRTILKLVNDLNYYWNKLFNSITLFYNYNNITLYPFLNDAQFTSSNFPTREQDNINASTQNQNKLITYVDERITYHNNKQALYKQLKIAENQLDEITYEISEAYERLGVVADKIASVDNEIQGWQIEKSGLENQDGIYARLEQEQPISSIYYLSNLQRVQYNYTYLTIRLKTKYTILRNVHSNISRIDQLIIELGDQVLADQVLLSELIRLKNSYNVVAQQLTVEIESMRAEYNRIRNEYYGLPPIAQGDETFDENPAFDANGNPIAEVAAFAYANPDLQCLAITE